MTATPRIDPADPRLAALVLENGAHRSPTDGLCLMEAVAWMRGVAHTDHPACVAPTIGAAGRAFNDNLPTDDIRTRLCVPLIPIIVGTATTAADEDTRAWLATDFLVREVTPSWMELAGLTATAAQLRAAPPLTNSAIALGDLLRQAQHESDAARAAARAAAGDAAWDAARAAAWAAARDAARDAARAAAGDAAWDAARDAAWDAARAAAWAAAGAAARDAARDAAWDAARAAAGAAARDAARDAAWAAAWDAAWDAAGAAAWAAAGDATYETMYTAVKARLTPTADRLNLLTVDLITRMAEVGR